MTSTSGLSFEEMSESLTGFDEIAIEKHMGIDVYTDGERKPIWMLRSLIFVHQRRQGLNDVEAREAALAMRLGDCNEYFESDDEVDEDEPETALGKDDSLPG